MDMSQFVTEELLISMRMQREVARLKRGKVSKQEEKIMELRADLRRNKDAGIVQRHQR